MGSYLLHSLSWDIIQSVVGFYDNNDEVILLPNVSEYRSLLKNGTSSSVGASPLAVLPNHFVALVKTDDVPKITDAMKGAMNEKWLPLCREVCGLINLHVREQYPDWCKLFSSQIMDHFRLLWVSHPVTWDQMEKEYQTQYQTVQLLMEERKLTRTFLQQHGSSARKCPQCGHREVMGPEKNDANKEFWNYLSDATRNQFPFRLKAKECLCGVCLVKRFISENALEPAVSQIPFDSTTDIASTDFRLRLKRSVEDTNGSHYISDFVSKINVLRKIMGKKEVTRVDEIPSHWLYQEGLTLQSLADETPLHVTHELTGAIQSAEESRMNLVRNLKVEPSKYYTLLMLDGDDMGKHISSLDLKKQRDLSASLLLLGNRTMPDIIDNTWKGYTIYSGGDDLLAFGPVEGVLESTKALFEAFRTALPGKTCSVAIVLAHHQDSLRTALSELRLSLKRAKTLYGKDAVAITIMKSSGTEVRGGFKRTIPPVDATEINFLDFLNDVVFRMTVAEYCFGASMLRDIADILDPFYKYDRYGEMVALSREPFRSAMGRVISRRAPSTEHATEEVKEDIRDFVDRFINAVQALSDPQIHRGMSTGR